MAIPENELWNGYFLTYVGWMWTPNSYSRVWRVVRFLSSFLLAFIHKQTLLWVLADERVNNLPLVHTLLHETYRYRACQKAGDTFLNKTKRTWVRHAVDLKSQQGGSGEREKGIRYRNSKSSRRSSFKWEWSAH
jgi:hypothetical protein